MTTTTGSRALALACLPAPPTTGDSFARVCQIERLLDRALRDSSDFDPPEVRQAAGCAERLADELKDDPLRDHVLDVVLLLEVHEVTEARDSARRLARILGGRLAREVAA